MPDSKELTATDILAMGEELKAEYKKKHEDRTDPYLESMIDKMISILESHGIHVDLTSVPNKDK